MKIEVKEVPRGETFTEKRAHSLVSVDLLEEEPQPTEPCVDQSCESYLCKTAHEYDRRLAEGESREQALTEMGLAHMVDNGDWRPRPEEDHKLWKAWRSRGIARMRVVAMEAMKQGLLPEMELSFSDKAGCSCGCSPGFRTKGESRGHWFFVKEVAA